MKIGTLNGGWAVFADCANGFRPVFGGEGYSVWECISWRKQKEQES